MAISPKPHTQPTTTMPPSMAHARVEAWTVSQAADALAATTLTTSSPRAPIRGMGVTIDIPLDDPPPSSSPPPQRLSSVSKPTDAVHTVYKRRTPVRRDSQRRRDALLMGKEGSRRRQRWENDRLLGNPWAEPPLPDDWAVRPTHPVQRVPYAIAPLWDAGYAAAAAARARQREKEAAVPEVRAEKAKKEVEREVRAKLKKARGAKGLLMDLEEEVRGFVREWERVQRELEEEGVIEVELSSEDDEEIVFVGRNGAMSDEGAERARAKREKKERAMVENDRVIFQSLVDDHGAAFG